MSQKNIYYISAMTKAELRSLYLKMRKAIPPAKRNELSGSITENFFKGFDLSSIHSLHCFISMRHAAEIETGIIFERLWKDFPDIQTLAPRINKESGDIDALPFTSADDLVENRWKIPEPALAKPIDPKRIDLVLVPLLCFDERGYRVGYGKGYYDRFLEKCREDCLRVGLSFFPPVKLIDGIHERDVALSHCITPDKIYSEFAD